MADNIQKHPSPHPPATSLHPPAPSPSGGEGVPRIGVSSVRRRLTGERARTLRQEATRSERILWEALRGRSLDGRRFRRQQPIGPFIVDFFCPSERLVVEVDGPVHVAQQDADQERQEQIEQAGYRVLRLPAALVEQSLPTALAQIRAAFSPSPAQGEGAGG